MRSVLQREGGVYARLVTGLFRWTPCGCWVRVCGGQVSTEHLVLSRVYA